MDRRAYLGGVVGVATTVIAGCLQGDAILHETQITATSPTKQWEVDLEAGNRMRLEVDKSDDSTGAVNGYVHRAETDEEIASTAASSGHEEFDVPATGTYIVSIEVGGSTGEIRLRDMN